MPFVFATGYDASALPSRLAQIVRCEKPVNVALVVSVIGRAVGQML